MTTQQILDTFLYDEERGKLFFKRRMGKVWAGSEAGYISNCVRVVQVHKKPYCIHRLIWQIHHGAIPNRMVIDHINGDYNDNRISNLRMVTQKINSRNQALKRNNKSGCPGVYWCKDRNKWCVEVHVDYKKLFIGRFDTLEKAVAARKQANPRYGFHQNHGRMVNYRKKYMELKQCASTLRR